MHRSPVRRERAASPRGTLAVELHNPAGAAIDRLLLNRLCRRVVAGEGLDGPLRLSVHLLGDAEIRQANREQRGIDEATDVLAFPLLAQFQPRSQEFALPPGEARHLGDVLISCERARAQAVEFGHSAERELYYLLVHGLLHLLGHDHVEPEAAIRMRPCEEAALEAFGLTR